MTYEEEALVAEALANIKMQEAMQAMEDARQKLLLANVKGAEDRDRRWRVHCAEKVQPYLKSGSGWSADTTEGWIKSDDDKSAIRPDKFPETLAGNRLKVPTIHFNEGWTE